MRERWIILCILAAADLGLVAFLRLHAMPRAAETAGQDSSLSSPPDVFEGTSFLPQGGLTAEESFGVYKVRTYRDGEAGDGSYEILGASRRIGGEHGWCFDIGGSDDSEEDQGLRPIGRDITGNGKVNVVMREWTGGAHCCFVASVLELDGGCRVIARIDGMDGVPSFRDVDGDSLPEVVVQDWTFAYWPTCFATSPAPQVVLRWSGKKYSVAPDLMTSPAPPEDVLAAKAAAIRNSPDWRDQYRWQDIPQELFGYALDLMYSGHEELGWRFIEMAWPGRFAPDTELLGQLKGLLEASDYWLAVKRYHAQRAVEHSHPSDNEETRLTRYAARR